MITSHYYKNTNNTPIMCDFEWGGSEMTQDEIEQRELEILIQDKEISPETRRKLINILKEEKEKNSQVKIINESQIEEESKEKKNEEYKYPNCINH